MTVDLVIKNGKIVGPSTTMDGYGVAIDGGKIVAIARDPNLPQADRTIDGKERLILPGLIEPHVHLGQYRSFDEDVLSETKSAAYGGITTMMHYAVTTGTYAEYVPILESACRKNSFIDMAFHLLIMNEQQIGEISSYVRSGYTTFKHLMNGPEYEKLFNVSAMDDGGLYESFKEICKNKGLAMVHCEDYGIVRAATAKVKARGSAKTLSDWEESRPRVAEYVAISQAIILAKVTGAPLYIPHATIDSIGELVNWARDLGVKIYVETLPIFLAKSVENLGMVGKTTPPLRQKDNVEGLWRALLDGYIDCVGNDHVSMKREQKMQDGDFWSVRPGVPGCETMLPVMITEGWKKRALPLERIVQLTAYNSAQIFGVRGKGELKVGNDGDLTIVDVKTEKIVRQDSLHSFCDFTPFEGDSLVGWPELTVSKGDVLVEEGSFVGKNGSAQVIKLEP